MAATVQIIFEGIDRASNVVQSIAAQAGKIGQGMIGIGDKMTGLGMAMTAVTAPIAIGLGLSATAAINFEKALAGVEKAANLSPKGLEEMSQQILELSRTIPLAATAIAGITEEGAKLGINGQEDLAEFTTLISEMSIAFDMASQEAATNAAMIVNAFQMKGANGEVDFGALREYGDVVNTLGDNMATTEAKILSTTVELSGTASTYKIMANETAALGAAFTSLGIQPNVAATAFKGAMTRMTNSTKPIAAAMEELGINVEDFEDAVNKGDAAQAFADAMQSINDSALDPIEKGKAITEVFGRNFDDTMGQAAAGSREFATALDLMDKSIAAPGSSMQESFDIMSKTTKSQLVIAKNAITEFGITIGSAMLPAINSVLHALTPLVYKLAEFGRAHPGITSVAVAVAAIAVAIGPVLIAIGLLVSNIGKIGAAFAEMKGIGAFSGLKTAIAGIAGMGTVPLLAIATAALLIYKAWKPLTTLFAGIATGFTEAIAAMDIDLTPLIAAAAAVKGLMATLFQQSDVDLSSTGEMIGGNLANLPTLIGQAVASFGSMSGVGQIFTAITIAVTGTIAAIIAFKIAMAGLAAWSAVVSGIGFAFTSASMAIAAAGGVITSTIGVITAVFSILTGVVSAVAVAIMTPVGLVITALFAWGAVLYTLVTRWNEVKLAAVQAILGITTFLTGAMASIGMIITTILTSIVTSVTSLGLSIGMAIQGILTSIVTSISSLGLLIGMTIQGIIISIVASVSSLGMSIGMAVQGIVVQVQAAIMGVAVAIQGTISMITGVLSSVMGSIVGMISSITASVSGAISNTIAAISSGLAALPGIIQGVGAQMIGTIQGLAGQFFSAGQAIIQQLAAGIQAAAGSAVAAIGNVAAQIRGALPFSPAKWGALSDIDETGGALMSEFARGIEPSEVMQTLGRSLQSVRNMLDPTLTGELDANGRTAPGAIAPPIVTPTLTDRAKSSSNTTNSNQSDAAITINYNPTISTGQGGEGDDLERKLRCHADLLANIVSRELKRQKFIDYGVQL